MSHLPCFFSLLCAIIVQIGRHPAETKRQGTCLVFAKADLWLAEYYDQRLVDKALWPLGKELRNLQEEDIKVVLAIANDSHLMADLPWIAESIQLRNIYTDPLNVLQAELLHRSRQAEKEGQEPDPRVEQALMVTIAGIAAGMRNTG